MMTEQKIPEQHSLLAQTKFVSTEVQLVENSNSSNGTIFNKKLNQHNVIQVIDHDPDNMKVMDR